MNRYLIYVIVLFLSASCTKDQDLTITVSYYNGVRYVADVGATAYLFNNTQTLCEDYFYATQGKGMLDGEEVYNIYQAEANVNGVILLTIPRGEYYLALVSEGGNTFSDKIINLDDGLSLIKNFGDDYRYDKEPW